MVDFLVLGLAQSFKYSNIFPLFVQKKMWLGTPNYSYHFWFKASDKYNITKSFKKTKDGDIIVNVNGCTWFTNMNHKYKVKNIELKQKYDPGKYRKFDGTDVIDVDSIYDIPVDYPSVMGVPINFIDKVGGDYELVGAAGCGGKYNMFLPVVDGKCLYCRILIKKKLT